MAECGTCHKDTAAEAGSKCAACRLADEREKNAAKVAEAERKKKQGR